MSKSKKKLTVIISIVIFALFFGFYTGTSICPARDELLELTINFERLQDKYDEFKNSAYNTINILNASYEQLKQKYSVLKQEYYYIESERDTLLYWLQDALEDIKTLENRIKELENIITSYEKDNILK